MHDLTTNDFQTIVLENYPLLDVRAPIEFEKGSFPTSTNLPILTNEERHKVGICYREKGNIEATRLGHQLVSGTIKQKRIEGWIDFFNQNPQGMLYCFRGGSRSAIAQQWIQEHLKRDVIRLEGGYKAFRHYLMNELEATHTFAQPFILGGYTGSGKTHLLKQVTSSIDLEGLANHRGSSFGGYITPQPSQIDFEHLLAYALIQHREKAYKKLIIEDEGRHVGRCYLPKTLSDFFNTGNLVILDVPLEQRIALTFDEYVVAQQHLYKTAFGEDGLMHWYMLMHKSISRLSKRLGGVQTALLLELLDDGHRYQCTTGSPEKHRQWVGLLLSEYYDPMYRYQLEHTEKQIVFRGDSKAVLDYLNA